jgi:predicted amidohydrolase
VRSVKKEGKIGTLAPGADADIAIFQMKETPLQLRDVFDDVLICHHVFIPRMTILGGSVVYRSLEFYSAILLFK